MGKCTACWFILVPPFNAVNPSENAMKLLQMLRSFAFLWFLSCKRNAVVRTHLYVEQRWWCLFHYTFLFQPIKVADSFFSYLFANVAKISHFSLQWSSRIESRKFLPQKPLCHIVFLQDWDSGTHSIFGYQYQNFTRKAAMIRNISRRRIHVDFIEKGQRLSKYAVIVYCRYLSNCFVHINWSLSLNRYFLLRHIMWLISRLND